MDKQQVIKNIENASFDEDTINYILTTNDIEIIKKALKSNKCPEVILINFSYTNNEELKKLILENKNTPKNIIYFLQKEKFHEK